MSYNLMSALPSTAFLLSLAISLSLASRAYPPPMMSSSPRDDLAMAIAQKNAQAKEALLNAYETSGNDELEGRRYRQNLAELLNALKNEEAMEEAEDEDAGIINNNEPMQLQENLANPPETSLPANVHSVDKRRRRRYGFWVTAINKMGNVKRSGSGARFIPALGIHNLPKTKRFIFPGRVQG